MYKDTVIQVYRIVFHPLNDIIAPVFSSRLSFTLFTRFLEGSWVKRLEELHSSKTPLKPYRFSPVFAGNRALFKNKREKVLVLHGGKRYWFKVTLVGLEPELRLTDKLEVFNGEIVVDEIEVSRRNFMELAGSERINEFKIYFRSPTFLSPKLCLPPRVRVHTAYKVYRLYPQPCLWVRSLVLYWNKYAPRELVFRDGYKFSRLADIYLMETSHEIRHVTVYYSKDKELIEHRGFMGWIKYSVVDEDFSRKLLSLLRLAGLVGIGKSRSMGFGYVEVEYTR